MKKSQAVIITLLVGALGAFGVGIYQIDHAGIQAQDQEVQQAPTAKVQRSTIQKTVGGVGEVCASKSEELKPVYGNWLKSVDVPLNRRVAQGESILTYNNKKTLDAPYDLVVTEFKLPDPNKPLVKGEHVIQVKRIDSLHLTLKVPESDLPLIAIGQPAAIRIASDEDTLREGTIIGINEVGTYDSNGSSFTVTVEMQNDGSVRLGMSADLQITIKEAVDVLTVPVSAVVDRDGKRFVSVLDPATGKAEDVEVACGLSDGTLVEITSGLDEGQTVLLNETSPEGNTR